MQTIWKESYKLSFLNNQCPHQDYWGTHTLAVWNINQHGIRFSLQMLNSEHSVALTNAFLRVKIIFLWHRGLQDKYNIGLLTKIDSLEPEIYIFNMFFIDMKTH
jgi:hypothetical protein